MTGTDNLANTNGANQHQAKNPQQLEQKLKILKQPKPKVPCRKMLRYRSGISNETHETKMPP